MQDMERAAVEVDAESRLLSELEQRWAALPSGAPEPIDFELVEALVADESRLRSAGRWVAGPTTLLEVLRLQRDEVRNCRVVRWALDPIAPHGFGAEALRLVLARVNELSLQQGLAPTEYDGVEQASVMVEEARGDTRADIVITGPAWMVVFEVKIGAGEQLNQGRRLSELWPDATYVYLTRRGGEMRTSGEQGWVRMRWGDLLAALREAADHPPAEAPSSPDVERARRALFDYLHGARSLAR